MDPLQPHTPRVEAAVLVPVYRRADGDLRLVLIRRSDVGAHGGHLALPGGKRDPSDGSLLVTALREAHEEMGIRRDQIDILAELPPIETRTTNFRIYPFLARLIQPVAWQPDEREVAEILDVSLAELSAAEVRLEDAPGEQQAPYYRVGKNRLWGVTFRLLRPLVARLLAGEWAIKA
ncbi:MAG TPA: CoA pyrophosphatase [Burkholderiales bacterium]|nr:CoA pyrophosphatase [Burkholderiales bacterium]